MLTQSRHLKNLARLSLIKSCKWKWMVIFWDSVSFRKVNDRFRLSQRAKATLHLRDRNHPISITNVPRKKVRNFMSKFRRGLILNFKAKSCRRILTNKKKNWTKTWEMYRQIHEWEGGEKSASRKWTLVFPIWAKSKVRVKLF